MIRDFMSFTRHVFQMLHFVRGVLVGLLILIVLCLVVLTAIEGLPLGEASYLSAITALTIGYGDITPTTAIGRIVCVVIGLVGVVFAGIVVAAANRALAQGVEEKMRREEASSGERRVM